VQVVYIADDGSVTNCETAVNADGSVTFITDHFSIYAIIGIASEAPLWIPISIVGAALLIGIAITAIIIKKRKKY